MANILGGLGGIVGGIGSFVSGSEKADAFEIEAKGFDTASNYAFLNALLSGEIGGLQELAGARKIQSVAGTQQAVAAANGLTISGSASNIIRDSTQSGYLQEGLIGLNTAIQSTNYIKAQQEDIANAEAARAQAAAAKSSGTFGALGGILGGIGSLFGL